MRRIAVLAAVGLAAACSMDTGNTGPNIGQPEARLRNTLPSTCTVEELQACPAPEVTTCPSGQEPVLDYSKDCCIHFTCQPVCVAAKPCDPTPAPVCPANTRLWIGTAVEDCCPAYRCEPSEEPTCDPKTAVCAQSMPFCGDGILPKVKGMTENCCPIYQCPCDADAGKANQSATSGSAPICGCTFPTCKEGEVLSCEGTGPCRAPCSCKPDKPIPGLCKQDADCASGQHCELKACMNTAAGAGTASKTLCDDPAKCGEKPAFPQFLCPDGKTTAGASGRCLASSAGTCSWEIIECPTDCSGVCVDDPPPTPTPVPTPAPTGCRGSGDCGANQTCVISCEGWACTAAAGGSATDRCSCPPNEPACKCDAAGTTCGVQTCKGVCVDMPKCDPLKPAACPAMAMVCPNGVRPEVIGTDPMTCCPIQKCPVCEPKPSTPGAHVCTVPPTGSANCPCIKLKGTDSTSCCPVYECGTIDSTTYRCK